MIPMILNIFTWFRLKRLASRRSKKEALDSFVQRLAAFDRKRVESVYSDMQKELILVGHFPILPEDRLFEDLEVDQGNLEVFFEERVPRQHLGTQSSVRTCADLADYVLSRSNPKT